MKNILDNNKEFVLNQFEIYKHNLTAPIMKRTAQQVNTAFDWLISKGILFDRKTIKSFDVINMINFNLPDEEENAVNLFRRDFYSWIPPLERGVLRILTRAYIYFELYDIDIDGKNYSMKMQVYESNPDDENYPWFLTFIADYTVSKGNDAAECSITINDYSDFYTIVTEYEEDGVTLKSLLWSNNDEKRFFKEYTLTVLEHLVDMKFAGFPSPAGVSNFEDETREMDDDGFLNYVFTTGISFLYSVSEANYMLSRNKPVAQRKTHNKSVMVRDENAKKPKRQIIRAVGGIKIKSVKIPKVPSEDSVRKYKVSVWNKRGHVRHYKSGKTVYIRQTICKRKCFDNNGVPLQTVIDIKNGNVLGV